MEYLTYSKYLYIFENRLFTNILQHTAGNVTQAARILDIHPVTLRNKMRKHGLEPRGRGRPPIGCKRG